MKEAGIESTALQIRMPVSRLFLTSVHCMYFLIFNFQKIRLDNITLKL